MKWRAKKVMRVGPYFRRLSASVSQSGSRAGWTSQGLKFGRLTVNTTRRTYTYDTPGPGAVYSPLPAWVVQALGATPLTRWLLRQPGQSGGRAAA